MVLVTGSESKPVKSRGNHKLGGYRKPPSRFIVVMHVLLVVAVLCACAAICEGLFNINAGASKAQAGAERVAHTMETESANVRKTAQQFIGAAQEVGADIVHVVDHASKELMHRLDQLAIAIVTSTVILTDAAVTLLLLCLKPDNTFHVLGGSAAVLAMLAGVGYQLHLSTKHSQPIAERQRPDYMLRTCND